MFLARVAVEGFRASVPGPLICDIPGRFSVLLGANGTGKSTVTDAIALAHADVFPWKPRATTASLAKTGQRSIETSYEYENSETIRIWKDVERKEFLHQSGTVGSTPPWVSCDRRSSTHRAKRAMFSEIFRCSTFPLPGTRSRIWLAEMLDSLSRCFEPKPNGEVNRHL
jgi:hypothetical protein